MFLSVYFCRVECLLLHSMSSILLMLLGLDTSVNLIHHMNSAVTLSCTCHHGMMPYGMHGMPGTHATACVYAHHVHFDNVQVQ